ncbi:MAG: glycosyltransferase [Bacteroidales bacterium]|jgi:hypothetical protein|nr:glycosyltransferase [Bacteroidales bacterium]
MKMIKEDFDMELAPIVLFVYNRPWHTEKTIEALKSNNFAKDSVLFIYCDGLKKFEDLENVLAVRNYVKTIRGFKKVEIFERDKNYGLALSIKKGVSEIVNRYQKVIVLEDDIVTSPYFLEFMNRALHTYENIDAVMEISGYNYPINTNEIPDAFFSSMAACWGWGTWSSSWNKYSEDFKVLEKLIKDRGKSKFIVSNRFHYWRQFVLNKKEKLSTWFIFWYASIYVNKGLCLYPKYTYVNNIGLDGS